MEAAGANNSEFSKSASALSIVPQLLLGGTTTPAQDLSTFLKTSPNLLIATPGRLLELLSSPHVHCPQSSFEVLVMDEADRLLDLGFKDDIQKILQRLPKQRRTGLFSASVSEAVDQIVRVGLRNPVRIAVKVKSASGAADQRTPASLQLSYLVTPPSQKLPMFSALLRALNPTPQKSIVYMSTCAAVDYFQHLLPVLIPTLTVVPLHGKHAPAVRQKNFSRFTNSANPALLLTTDVAARGLDIPSVDLVVQLDPPSDPKAFLHRCGRAGRAGRKGLAVTFLTPGREEDYISFLSVRRTPITPLTHPKVVVSVTDAAEISAKLRTLVLEDRALYDKAQRAFVSWVQAYSKHAASSIFRVADLQWEEMAQAWALLKLPKMPELRSWEGDRTLGLDVDFDTYAYKDKQREKNRRLELGAQSEGGDVARSRQVRGDRGRIRAWSHKKNQKELKEMRREKKNRRREKERLEKMTVAEIQEQERLEAMIKRVRSKREQEEELTGFDS